MIVARDTIFALSSGTVPSGVAVIRVSGPAARMVSEGFLRELPEARKAILRRLRDADGSTIDEALVLWFPAPHSFTGEDCLELQIHGSRAVINRIFARLREDFGCRMAEAGEFSRRAFENGKLDLIEIEGLSDLLAAETEMQRRLAMELGSGKRSAVYAGWRERILQARAMLEAELDFADEEDIPDAVADRFMADIHLLSKEIRGHTANRKGGAIIREGFRIAIIGAPNAGKSSFLNHIAKREIAIVTDIPGTTRDVIECDIDVDGYLVRFADTAGIRETLDEVERIGVSRALEKIAEADLVLLLDDESSGSVTTIPELEGKTFFRVATKADMTQRRASDRTADFTISSMTGEGIDELLRGIGAEIGQQVGLYDNLTARERHLEILSRIARELERAADVFLLAKELAAEHLRSASDGLGKLAGRIDTEEVLGAIFSSFCIGK